MNEIKIKVKFKKGLCYSQGINLVTNDYNSTKLVFEFDDNEGTKIFEMKDPDDIVVFADEIVNNELILVSHALVTTKVNNVTYIKYTDGNGTIYWYDEDTEKLYDIEFIEVQNIDIDTLTKVTKDTSLFKKAGNYTFEVSLYKDNSKLTSASDKFKVNAEQVIIDGEIVETYTPMFDNLLSDLSSALQETDNIDIDVNKVGNTATVIVTKKDGTEESVEINDGIDGITPTIGENGNWFLGDTDTGLPSRGVKGDTGANGLDAKINGVNTLTIEAGTNITLDQEGNILTINSTGGGGDYHDDTKQDVIDNTLTTINKTIPTAINEVNSIVYNTLPKITGTGTSVTLNDTSNTIMKLNLNATTSSQEGTPSPSNPQTIHTITGNNKVLVRSINLWDTVLEAGGYNLITGKKISNNYHRSANYIPITPNSAMEFMKPVGKYTRVLFYDKNKNFLGAPDLIYTNYNYTAFTSLNNAYYMTFLIDSYSSFNNDLMIYYGSTSKPYEPYQSQTYPINLGSMELCKIGDYEDILFKNTINSEYYNSSLELNMWYKISNVGKIIYDGSQAWSAGGNSKGITYFYKTLTDKINGGTIFCNLFTQRSSLWTLDEYTDCIVTEANNKILSIMLSDNTITTSQLFETWLSTHNTIVYYPLATPTYTLLNDTLQTQLDNIQYALAYDTQTNISQTNNDLPFIISAETYKEIDLTDYVKNTDYASSSKGGVIKTGYGSNIDSNGNLYASNFSYANYQTVGNNNFISKGTLENVITGKGLIDSSYHDSTKQDIEDNTLTTVHKTIPEAINEVDSIAKGANQALSYVNYSAMVTAFNSLANNVYNTGQNVMIVTLQVPDLWISGIESTSQTYTYTTDEAFTTELSTNGYVQVGYYKLSALETQKVDLTDYATKTYVNNLFNSIVDGDEVSY